MSPAIRKFARFYYPEFQRDYPEVYTDDAAFSAWLRLLVIAEQAWPARAELPRSIRPKALRTLTDRGLVAVTGHAFAIKGFAAERSRRHDAALVGVMARYANGPPNADPNASTNGVPNAATKGETNADTNAMPSTKTSTKTNTKGIQGRRSLVEGAIVAGPVDPER